MSIIVYKAPEPIGAKRTDKDADYIGRRLDVKKPAFLEEVTNAG